MIEIPLVGLQDLTVNTIFCIGRNYAEHARELNNEVPDQPVVFLKPVSSIIQDGATIQLPPSSREVHHEVELLAAIGKSGKNIAEDQAHKYIAGYGIGIDVTARDIQQKAKSKRHPWAVAKGFDTFAPISRFLPAAEIGDPQQLSLELRVNGKVRQQGNTADMIFTVPSLVSYLSGIFTLSPGDLIFTGTPEGVSPIKQGDHIEARLQGGLLTLSVNVSS
ncbi:MAG: fumarylacetoacetate hydrolase family protein [Balneolaceae bacterium]|nr:fumarylacetoacetate hydrolase family protein [Balneolaceae bacterium]